MKSVFLRVSLFLAVLLTASMASAQTRTWVEGNGNDANPCSFTAPCKTYSGAFGKTAIGGTISTIDAGAYGAVTITHSITIDGSESLASILASAGTTGVIVNAGISDVVILRNLDVFGAGSGADGIRINQAGEVYIENCRINGFTSSGIKIMNVSNDVKVHIRNTESRNNSVDGLIVVPSGTGTAKVSVENSHFAGNTQNGVHVAGANNQLLISNSNVNGNANGLVVEQTTSKMYVQNTTVAFNATAGVQPGVAGNVPVIQLSGSIVVGNGTGILTSPGQVIGYQNNTVVANTGGNSVNSSTPQQ